MHELKTIEDLSPDPENPRTITDEAFAGLGFSIEEFGDLSGITWNSRTGELVCGHQRVSKLIELGGVFDYERCSILLQGESFDVRVVDWDRDKQRGANLAANNQSIAGKFTSRARDILDQCKIGLGREKFKAMRMDRIYSDIKFKRVEFDSSVDSVPRVRDESVTKHGDVWELGDHVLVCGDSASLDSISSACRGEKASLFATDPPYGVAYGVETEHGKQIENDENDGVKLQAFLESVFKACAPHLKDNAAWYLWHAQMTQGYFAAAAAAAADILIHRQIVWVKPSLVLGHGDFHWRHELCYYGWKNKNRPPWYADRKQTTVWEIGRENNGIHPTQKPVEVFARPILYNTLRGDLCLEPFAGSGSQFIAAEKLERRCCGLEISPQYCDVIIERWEQFSGGKAVRKSR